MKLTGTQKGLLIFFIGFALAFILNMIFPGGRVPAKADANIQARSFYQDPKGELEPSIQQDEPLKKLPSGPTYIFSYQDYYLHPVTLDEPGKPSYTFDDRYWVDQRVHIKNFNGGINLGELLRSKLNLPDTTSTPDPGFRPIIKFEGFLEPPSR